MDGFKTRIKLWDKEKKIMLPSAPLYKCDFYNVDTSKYIPLFSTGLKDKNGKVIYEGDIIKIENHSSQIQKMELIGVASYGSAAWCVEIKKVNKWEKYSVPEPTTRTILYFLNLVNSKRYEIIGNIHGSPELITKTI